jgi:hypothetical protein
MLVRQCSPLCAHSDSLCLTFQLNALANTYPCQHLPSWKSHTCHHLSPFPVIICPSLPSLLHCQHLARITHSCQFENVASDLPSIPSAHVPNSHVGLPPMLQHLHLPCCQMCPSSLCHNLGLPLWLSSHPYCRQHGNKFNASLTPQGLNRDARWHLFIQKEVNRFSAFRQASWAGYVHGGYSED